MASKSTALCQHVRTVKQRSPIVSSESKGLRPCKCLLPDPIGFIQACHCMCMCPLFKLPCQRSLHVSSESSALSQISHRPAGARTHSDYRTLYMSVCVSQSVKLWGSGAHLCHPSQQRSVTHNVYPGPIESTGLVFVCVSSESTALSQISHRPAGAWTQLDYRTLYICVCVCKSVSQASGAAEPTCVIRVNGAQSLTLFTQDQLGQPGLFSCACVCLQFKPPRRRSPHVSSESSALSPSQ